MCWGNSRIVAAKLIGWLVVASVTNVDECTNHPINSISAHADFTQGSRDPQKHGTRLEKGVAFEKRQEHGTNRGSAAGLQRV